MFGFISLLALLAMVGSLWCLLSVWEKLTTTSMRVSGFFVTSLTVPGVILALHQWGLF